MIDNVNSYSNHITDLIVLPSPVEYVRKRYFSDEIDFDFACKMINVRLRLLNLRPLFVVMMFIVPVFGIGIETF